MKMQCKLQRQDHEAVERNKKRVVGVLFIVYHLQLKTTVVNSIMHIDLRCNRVTIS